MVLEGAGICLMAGFLVQDDLDAGRLVRLLPEYRPVEMSMNAVYPQSTICRRRSGLSSTCSCITVLSSRS